MKVTPKDRSVPSPQIGKSTGPNTNGNGVKNITLETRQIQDLQEYLKHPNAIQPAFPTFKPPYFYWWQRLEFGNVTLPAEGGQCFRGYLQVDHGQIPEAVKRMIRVAEDRSSEGKATCFKVLLAKVRVECIENFMEYKIGVFQETSPDEPVICLYSIDKNGIEEIFNALIGNGKWQEIESARTSYCRRKGTSSYFDQAGKEWRSLNCNTGPGYSEDTVEAYQDDWRDHVIGTKTVVLETVRSMADRSDLLISVPAQAAELEKQWQNLIVNMTDLIKLYQALILSERQDPSPQNIAIMRFRRLGIESQLSKANGEMSEVLWRITEFRRLLTDHLKQIDRRSQQTNAGQNQLREIISQALKRLESIKT